MNPVSIRVAVSITDSRERSVIAPNPWPVNTRDVPAFLNAPVSLYAGNGSVFLHSV